MLVIRAELHSAITGKVTELGTLVIMNDGTGDLGRGNYDCVAIRKGGSIVEAARNGKSTRRGRVEGYARRSRPVWELVRTALRALGYKESGIPARESEE